MAFRFSHTLDGSDPIIMPLVVADTIVLSRGEMVIWSSQEVTTATTNSDAFLGITTEAVDNTADGESAHVIINRWAVYEVDDANARTFNDPLDIATGGLAVAANSNGDLRVVATTGADEPTYVVINTGHHVLDVVAS